MEATTTRPFDIYRDELVRRPLRLERAEEILDAVLADSSLAHEQREELVWYFYRRGWEDIDEARRHFLDWRADYRASIQHNGVSVAEV